MNGLEITNLTTGYGDLKVVRGLALECPAGEITALLGRNGAGKSTTLLAVSGLLPAGGDISIFGEPLKGSVSKRIRSGLALVQEGKRIFRERTVEENLRLGGFTIRGTRGGIDAGIERSYERFPILKEKRKHAAGSLSGGQQQMLAICQALMPNPRVLMLDEPSAGLAPAIVEEVFGEINELKKEGMCVLLVEQQIDNSLAVADSVAVLDNGRIVLRERVADMANWDALRESYLGVPA
jgi:branched-chain amino acid transport system ATP-binding protein